ncbi:MAG: PqiC family protein [Sneathiella sp.]|nr:PqiC family protein [Sneathiella sp.]
MAGFYKSAAVQKLAILALITVVLGACSALPGSDPTRFYILKPASGLMPENGKLSLAEGINVGIGPVQIPGYADRSQIVTFDAGSQITVSDFDHWAEPLSEGIKRVVSANVSTLIGSGKVFPYPADFRPGKQSIQVAIEIIDVTQMANGTAKLSARWHIKQMYDNQVVIRNSQTYEKEAVAGDYGSYANALSELLGRLSVDIALSLARVDFK